MRAAPLPRTLILGPLAGIPLAGLGVVTAEIVYAVRRRLPHFQDLDPSGTFGDPSSPPLRVVAMGDSCVTGVGLDDCDPVWVRGVARHLARRHHVRLHSVAAGGSRVLEVLIHQLPAALAIQPDLALISVGANDALRGTSLGPFERQLDRIVGALTDSGAAVALLGVGDLGTIPRLPTPLNLLARARARRIDAAEARVVARHPGAAKSEAWGGEVSTAFGSRAELFAPDLFHASALGHALWAELAIPAAEAALGALR